MWKLKLLLENPFNTQQKHLWQVIIAGKQSTKFIKPKQHPQDPQKSYLFENYTENVLY